MHRQMTLHPESPVVHGCIFCHVTCEYADHICHQLMEEEVMIQWLSQ